MTLPIVEIHDGIIVVRDDLFPGGTKARFLGALFENRDELVYASPAEGGAQTAIATVARSLGKKATIFVAKRKNPHPRALMAKALGENVYQVSPGYLSVVQARAREYVTRYNAAGTIRLAPFGVDTPEAIDAIAAAALATTKTPDMVWCAAGSGVLARGLAKAWPNADRHVVQVGRELTADDVAGATIHKALVPFERPYTGLLGPKFPSDPHYDAKAWASMMAWVKTTDGRFRPGFETKYILFWNVTGPAATHVDDAGLPIGAPRK